MECINELTVEEIIEKAIKKYDSKQKNKFKQKSFIHSILIPPVIVTYTS